MVEGSTAERVKATEEGAADAAGDAVVVARSGWVNELVARYGHGCSVASQGAAWPYEIRASAGRRAENRGCPSSASQFCSSVPKLSTGRVGICERIVTVIVYTAQVDDSTSRTQSNVARL